MDNESFYSTMQSLLIYWLAFGISIFIAYIYQKKFQHSTKASLLARIKNNLWLTVIIMIPTIVFGLRDVQVGRDTMNMAKNYLNTPSWEGFNEGIFNALGTGPLFIIFRYISYYLFNGNYGLHFISLAFITLFILVKGLDKWGGKFLYHYHYFYITHYWECSY